MKKRINSSAWTALLLAVLVAGCGNAWAASAICQKPDVEKEGGGIGGTGMLTKGTGVGGTGLRPDDGKKLLQLAGSVIESKGAVEALQSGKSRRLAKNDPVCAGETVATSNTGSVRIKMVDGGLIEVRPHSRIMIESFDYGLSKRKKSMIALLEGTSRFVTGKIGKEYPQNVIVRTPSGIIGVHGTDHETTVILPGGKGGVPAGTYDMVNTGVTFIRTAAGEIDIYPDQVGFAATEGEPPVLLHEIPDFLQANLSSMRGGVMHEEDGLKADSEGTPHTDLHSSHAGGESEHPGPVDTLPSTMDVHEIGDLPHLPELIEPPELPETPEMPELPEMPDE